MAFGSKLLIKGGFTRKVSDGHPNAPYAKQLKRPSHHDYEHYLKEKGKKGAELSFNQYVNVTFKEKFEKIEQELGIEKAEAVFEDIADHDWMEIARDQMIPTFYPTPLTRHHIIYESPKYGIEPVYFWCLHHLDHDVAFPTIYKVTDIFSAAQHSSFYGAGAQRLGLAQDKVVQFLATMGKMIKELFQMVRELRWIDERVEIYKEAIESKGANASAERTLKGMWVDLVDGVIGGQRTGSNILIMAQQLQFSTLPDLFFNIHPQDTKEIDRVVDTQASGFNLQVRGTLKAKLQQYLQWRRATYAEMVQRRKFTIDYLAQHFNIIRMYMNWAKPYLKHIQALSTDMKRQDDASIITAFETSRVEVEILGQKAPQVKKVPKGPIYYAVMILNFEFQTRPALSFSQEGGYHRGPLHAGTTKMFWRCYAWTQEQIDAYLTIKNEEDLELMKLVDKSLEDAMDALGDDLRNYLEQVRGQIYPKPKVVEKHEHASEKQAGLFEPFELVFKGLAEPFAALGRGVKEGYKVFVPGKGGSGGGHGHDEPEGKDAAKKAAVFFTFVHYKNFKKSHGLLAF